MVLSAENKVFNMKSSVLVPASAVKTFLIFLVHWLIRECEKLRITTRDSPPSSPCWIFFSQTMSLNFFVVKCRKDSMSPGCSSHRVVSWIRGLDPAPKWQSQQNLGLCIPAALPLKNICFCCLSCREMDPFITLEVCQISAGVGSSAGGGGRQAIGIHTVGICRRHRYLKELLIRKNPMKLRCLKAQVTGGGGRMLPSNLGLEVPTPVVTKALLERHLPDSLKP